MRLNGRLKTAFIVLLIIGSGACFRAPTVYGASAYDFVQSASSASWASWAGDSNHLAAESPQLRFTVEAPPLN
jgi:hypothetical protein